MCSLFRIDFCLTGSNVQFFSSLGFEQKMQVHFATDGVLWDHKRNWSSTEDVIDAGCKNTLVDFM